MFCLSAPHIVYSCGCKLRSKGLGLRMVAYQYFERTELSLPLFQQSCLHYLWSEVILDNSVLPSQSLSLIIGWDTCDKCYAVVSEQWTERQGERESCKPQTDFLTHFPPADFDRDSFIRFKKIFSTLPALRFYGSAQINKCILWFWNSSLRACVHIVVFPLSPHKHFIPALPSTFLPEKYAICCCYLCVVSLPLLTPNLCPCLEVRNTACYIWVLLLQITKWTL